MPFSTRLSPRAFAAFLLVVAGAAFGQAPQPPEVAAKSYIVLDLTSTRRWPSAPPMRRPTRPR